MGIEVTTLPLDEPKAQPAAILLRPYQRKMVGAWQAFVDRGGQRGLIVAATGSGKSVTLSAIVSGMAEGDPGFTALLMAHRRELLDQLAGTMGKVAPHLPTSVHCGDRKAGRGSRVVAASVQSIGNATSEALSWLGPNLVVADEAHHSCFVAGTVVDGRPIESLRVGELVTSYNRRTSSPVSSRIVATMRREPDALVRVALDDGRTLVCTGDHAFFTPDAGKVPWTPASALVTGASVMVLPTDADTYNGKAQEDRSPELRRMRHVVPARSSQLHRDPLLLRGVQILCKGCSRQARRAPLFRVRRSRHRLRFAESGDGAARTGLLLGVVQSGVRLEGERGSHGGHQSSPRLSTHGGEQPDAIRTRSIEGVTLASGDGAPSAGARGQRQGADRASETSLGAAGLDHRVRGAHPCQACERDADALQDRHRGAQPHDRRRDRREESSHDLPQGAGRPQGCIPRLARVDRVEVLERGGDGRYGGLCPDGFVYDIEVERHHAFFANGVLVHNCAATYQNVFSRFGCYDDGGCHLLGVTATPHRLDNKALVGNVDKAIFEEIVFRYDIRDAIREGFLVDLRGYQAAAVELDLSKVKTKGKEGDYDQGALERAMNVEAINELALKSWREAADGRKAIVFCAGVDHAKAVADVFRLGGVPSEAIYGDMKREDREAAIARFRSGETLVLTNMDVLTEGFDCPDAGAVVLLRPTKSWSLYAQMLGRGLRTLPGVIEGIENGPDRRAAIRGSVKPDCVIVDVVGLTSAQKIENGADGTGDASLQGLVGLPPQLDIEGRTISDALDLWEELPEPVKAAAFRRPTSFSGLSAVLTQVEMLADVDVPPEVDAVGAGLYWIRTGESVYTVECGNDPRAGQRRATLSVDLLGGCSLRLSVGKHSRDYDLPETLAVAVKAAEVIIERTFANASALSSRNAKWRTADPTDAQLKVLRDAGIHEEVLGHLNKGKASAMIAMVRRQSVVGGEA